MKGSADEQLHGRRLRGGDLVTIYPPDAPLEREYGFNESPFTRSSNLVKLRAPLPSTHTYRRRLPQEGPTADKCEKGGRLMSDPLFPFRKEAEIYFRSCENPRTSVTASRGVECLITANPYKNTFVRVLRIGELSKEEAEVVEERFGQIADTFLDDVSRS